MSHRNQHQKHGNRVSSTENSRRTFAVRLGLRLASSRRRAGLTQYELADRSGIRPWMVSRYERGENVPPVPTLDTLATILVVSVDYLLSREGAVPPEEQQP